MNRTLRVLGVGLLLGAAACDGSPVDPGGGGGGGGSQTPLCPVTPDRVNTPGNLPALGLGCVLDRYTSELWVHNGWAYTGTWSRRNTSQGVNAGNVLYVWNVSGNTPVLRDSVLVSEATTLGDVQATDDGRHLVVSTEGGRGSIVVYQLTDPAKPQEIARLSSVNTQSGVHTAEVSRVNGKLYAFLSVTSQSKVVIVDLSDPSVPREVTSITAGNAFTHDVYVRDGLLFTASWGAGMVVWDIGGGGRGGSPESPVRISSLVTLGGKVHNIWWYHDPSGAKKYAIIGEEGPASIGTSSSGDIHVVDISDLASPREVAYYTVAGAGTHNFWVDEPSGVLYAAYYNGGVRALDIRGDLAACTAAQKDGAGRCNLGQMGREVGRALIGGGQVSVWGVQMVGSHLYASDMLNGLWKLNISSLKR